MQVNLYKLTTKRKMFDERLAEIDDAEGKEIVRKAMNRYARYWFAAWCIAGPFIAPLVFVYVIGYGIMLAADWVSEKVMVATDALGDLINLIANYRFLPGWERATNDLCDAFETYAPTRMGSKDAHVPRTGETPENP